MFVKKISDLDIDRTGIDKLYEILDGCKFWLAGGCFASLLNKEKPKDYDLFFPCKEEKNKAKELLLCSGLKIDMSDSYNCTYVDHDFSIAIQVVESSYYESAEELISSFDFCHCKMYMEHDSNKSLHIQSSYYLSVAKNKELIACEGFKNRPMASLARAFKFCQRGFKIRTTDDLSIIAMAVNKAKVDWSDPEIDPFSGYSDEFQDVRDGLLK